MVVATGVIRSQHISQFFSSSSFSLSKDCVIKLFIISIRGWINTNNVSKVLSWWDVWTKAKRMPFSWIRRSGDNKVSSKQKTQSAKNTSDSISKSQQFFHYCCCCCFWLRHIIACKDPLPKCRTFRAAERKRNATLRKKTKKRKLRKDKQKSEKYPLNSTCVALLTHSSDAVWQSVLRFPWNTHHIFIVYVSVLHNIACRKIPNKSLTLPLSPSFSRSTYAE